MRSPAVWQPRAPLPPACAQSPRYLAQPPRIANSSTTLYSLGTLKTRRQFSHCHFPRLTRYIIIILFQIRIFRVLQVNLFGYIRYYIEALLLFESFYKKSINIKFVYLSTLVVPASMTLPKRSGKSASLSRKYFYE